VSVSVSVSNLHLSPLICISLSRSCSSPWVPSWTPRSAGGSAFCHWLVTGSWCCYWKTEGQRQMTGQLRQTVASAWFTCLSPVRAYLWEQWLCQDIHLSEVFPPVRLPFIQKCHPEWPQVWGQSHRSALPLVSHVLGTQAAGTDFHTCQLRVWCSAKATSG
jgi:hypothetical protein